MAESRMKLTSGLLLACLLSSLAAHAQSLQNQIDSVFAVQEREQARQRELLQEQAAREERAAAQQRAAQAAREHARAAAAKSARDEAVADKRRDQQYEDRLRDLAVRGKELELKRLEARTKREDEFIDRELAHQRAETDVVQSQADANRDVASGAKTFLQQSGTKIQIDAHPPTPEPRVVSGNGNGEDK
jgi:hypothetical protein